MFNKVLIIANPGSGKGEAIDHAKGLKEKLIQTYQADVDIRPTEKFEDAAKWASHSKKDGYDTVIAMGGDGTVNQVVSGLMKIEEAERPYFAFIGMGTANDLARAVGYPLNAKEAMEALQNVKAGKLDVGQVNDQYFINVLALGPIPQAVLQTDSQMKNTLGYLAYILEGAKAMLMDQAQKIEITRGAENYIVSTRLLIYSLTSSVGGYDRYNPQAKVDDGQGYLLVFKEPFAMATFKAMIRSGKLPDNDHEDESFLYLKADQIEIRQVKGEDLVTNIDGDEGPKLPVTIKVWPSAISLLVPKN